MAIHRKPSRLLPPPPTGADSEGPFELRRGRDFADRWKHPPAERASFSQRPCAHASRVRAARRPTTRTRLGSRSHDRASRARSRPCSGRNVSRAIRILPRTTHPSS
jgi:hypothetical protein